MFGVLTKLIKPVLSLVISTPGKRVDFLKAQDSLMAKNWRPWTAVLCVVLIGLDGIGTVSLGEETILALAATLVAMVLGRSYEKRGKDS